MAMKRKKPTPPKKKIDTAKLRPFKVKRGGQASICDDEGKMCYNGDIGKFTKERAESLAKLGLLHIEFDFNEPDAKAGKASEAYQEEATPEPTAESPGDEPDSGTGSATDDEAAGEDTPRPRRKRNL